MRKNTITIILQLVILIFAASHVFAQKMDYEKYGRIAIAVVTADYPSDKVVDYQYMGRKNVTENSISDSFRFQVEEKGVKFFVTVNVLHSVTNDKLLNLTVETEKP